MTQEQFRTRVERADREVFVITQGEDGYHIRSVRNPANSYLVSDTQDGWLCSCPDFETHATEEPSWTCKHILAVQKKCLQPGNYEAAERAAIASEERATEEPKPAEPPAQMVIKRSVSPDGRIDSVSIEFSLPVSGASEGGIKVQQSVRSGSKPRSPGSFSA